MRRILIKEHKDHNTTWWSQSSQTFLAIGKDGSPIGADESAKDLVLAVSVASDYRRLGLPQSWQDIAWDIVLFHQGGGAVIADEKAIEALAEGTGFRSFPEGLFAVLIPYSHGKQRAKLGVIGAWLRALASAIKGQEHGRTLSFLRHLDRALDGIDREMREFSCDAFAASNADERSKALHARAEALGRILASGAIGYKREKLSEHVLAMVLRFGDRETVDTDAWGKWRRAAYTALFAAEGLSLKDQVDYWTALNKEHPSLAELEDAANRVRRCLLSQSPPAAIARRQWARDLMREMDSVVRIMLGAVDV